MHKAPEAETDEELRIDLGHYLSVEVVAIGVLVVLIVVASVWIGRRAGTETQITKAGAGAAHPSLRIWEGYRSATYSDPARWVCRPDTDDICDHDLDTTVIAADGSTSIERFTPDPRAPIDCFYVYPTVSKDLSANSDLVPSPDEEGAAAHLQAARFGTQCRVFAPVYRQRTLTDLMGGVPSPGAPSPAGKTPVPTSTIVPTPYGMAYDDVLDAFKHYIANDNNGRGFVLIGQAQGSTMLTALLQREIAADSELRAHLVSALLIGFPTSADRVDPDAVPPCRRPGQIGCVISYASYRATAPPPSNAAYGRTEICTNPAALGGSKAPLHPYFPAARLLPFIDPALSPKAPPWVDSERGVTIATPFVSIPGLIDGECLKEGSFTYLSITVNGDPADPRTDDITGDLVPSWGLHLVDMDLAMGNLIDVVAEQRAAYID